MSQEKVDYHKEQKRNRQKIMKKEKRMRRLEITIAVVILAALVVWFGTMVVRNKTASSGNTGTTTELNLGSVENYLSDLQALYTDEEAEAEP